MLVEVPKWMFDAAECAEMRIEALARIDCETLRALMKTIIEQRASLKSAVIQPVKPVMETRMEAANRKKQLTLFGEQHAAPRWNDLPPQTRVEVVNLLAHLLISTRAGSPVRVPQEQRGGRDE
jgi:hypothetical protein